MIEYNVFFIAKDCRTDSHPVQGESRDVDSSGHSFGVFFQFEHKVLCTPGVGNFDTNQMESFTKGAV